MNYLDSMKKTIGFLTLAALSVSIGGCSGTAENSESIIQENPASEMSAENDDDISVSADTLSDKTALADYSGLFSDRDKNPEFDNISAEIMLKGSSAQCDGDGVSVSGSQITITQEGIYRISGTLDDGQIIVNAGKGKVQLILDNADITCSASSPIYGADSDKIFISLAEGSENTLSDGTSYNFEDETSQEPDACIFSNDSLTINGSGILNINANFADGIHSKDDIVITGGNININSVGDGIKGKDYVAVCGGNISITSGQDGIKSTEKNDVSLGFIYTEGGEFRIDSQNDGIQSETDLIITGGTFDIVSGGGSENSSKTHSDMGFGGHDFGGADKGDFTPPDDWDFGNMTPPDGFGGDMTPPDGFGSEMTPPGGFNGDMTPSDNSDFSNMTPPDGDDGGRRTPPEGFSGDMQPPQMQAEQTSSTKSTDSSDNTSSESFKGLKGGTSVQINGGTITVDSADDAVHSNGNVSVSGGSLALSAGDDGIHGDSEVNISDGNIVIANSYEGIEGAIIEVNGGTIDVRSSDDGFNASDGTPQNGMGTYSGGVGINIKGGLVYVDADGDGLDSNGDIAINGGTVIVNGPSNGGNGALDSNNEIKVTGGTLIAAGFSEMAEYPGDSSTQYTVAASFEETCGAGTLVTLMSENGTEIFSFAPSKSFNNIVISSPDIEKNKSYTFYLGGTSGAKSSHGLYENGGYNNDGSESESFTADKIISSVGSRSGMSGGFGKGKRH